MEIVSRAEWGARAPKRPTPSTTWAKRIGVAFHYSDGSKSATPRDLQAYAMDDLNYADTHYNFFVDWRGVAYEGRGWLVIAAHAKDQNTPWIGVCFIGREGDVTPAALRTMRDLYDEACRRKGSALRYSGHGQLPGQNTDCPGATIKGWISGGMIRPASTGVINLYAVLGDTGEAVKEMQKDLILAGFSVGASGADSSYGPATARGVAAMAGAGDGSRYQADERARLQELLRARHAGGVTLDQVREMIESSKVDVP